MFQCLATGRWFSPDPPVSSTNKTDRHDIDEILLKVALKPPNKQNVLLKTSITSFGIASGLMFPVLHTLLSVK
jgi:hypothetical protein